MVNYRVFEQVLVHLWYIFYIYMETPFSIWLVVKISKGLHVLLYSSFLYCNLSSLFNLISFIFLILFFLWRPVVNYCSRFVTTVTCCDFLTATASSAASMLSLTSSGVIAAEPLELKERVVHNFPFCEHDLISCDRRQRTNLPNLLTHFYSLFHMHPPTHAHSHMFTLPLATTDTHTHSLMRLLSHVTAGSSFSVLNVTPCERDTSFSPPSAFLRCPSLLSLHLCHHKKKPYNHNLNLFSVLCSRA